MTGLALISSLLLRVVKRGTPALQLAYEPKVDEKACCGSSSQLGRDCRKSIDGVESRPVSRLTTTKSVVLQNVELNVS